MVTTMVYYWHFRSGAVPTAALFENSRLEFGGP